MSSRLKRFLVALIGVIIVIIIIGVVFGIFTVRRSFPQTSGEIVLSGLDGPVDVYRDSYGIPHIYASTHHDLYYAQGFLHAQDRFWQMDFWRHIGSGRLAEMFGESQFETDVFLRTLGWARVVEEELELLDSTSLEILEAYTEGVNSYLANHHGSEISLEYAILSLLNPDYEPEPWQELHTLTWAKAMAWDLRANMEAELERAWLLKYLSAEQVAELYPPYPDDHPVIVSAEQIGWSDLRTVSKESFEVSADIDQALLVQALSSILKESVEVETLLGPAGSGIGSNSWAISGELSATGAPLFANDPHLGIQMPSIWYEIGLHCAPKNSECQLDIEGFSFAGVPGIIIGHNDRIAWGFTNAGPDVTDIYVEKINPDNPDQYEVNGEWQDMEKLTETINVAGGEPKEIIVRYTQHGPIIWDSVEGRQEFRDSVGLDLPTDFALALRWTALEPSETFPAVWKINLAKNWDEFRAAASHFDVPSQNMLYADVDGNIGYQTPGKIPIRANGDGHLPVPGWTGEFEWTGYIPFEDLPTTLNPEEGFIITANNAITDQDYPYLLSRDFNYGFRAQRIIDMFESAGGQIDIEYFKRMQGDNKDLNAELLVPILLNMSMGDSNLDDTLDLLRNWDYQNEMESAPAALFNVFWKHLLAETFHDELPEELWPGGGDRYFEVIRNLVKDPDSSWWDNQDTSSTERMEDIFKLAFSGAVDEINDLQGTDPARWNWGELHTSSFRNATLGESGIAPIESLFNRGPYPTAGGASIVNANSWSVLEPYIVNWVPSMRMIVDLGELNNSLTMHTTGQSGHAYHPNYIDMADPWRNIEYHPMLWERQRIEEQSTAHLRLVP